MTYKEFADAMVKKYGFCNWQCEDAWKAAQAAITGTPTPHPVTEEDVEAAREFLHDIDNGMEMRSALKQLRKEVIQELIDRGILATSYQMYLALFREGE